MSERLGEMIVYVARRSAGDARFSAAKLNAIMYFADFQAYRRFGRSISGDEYTHGLQGPTPKHLMSAREQLLADGSLRLEERRDGPATREVIVAMREAERGRFTADELATIDAVIDDLGPLNSNEVSELARREPGWRLTEVGETIPYRTAWLSGAELSEKQIAAGREIAERHGLLG